MPNFRKVGLDFTDGVRAPHYTNGRLLTAEDLQYDQQATLKRLDDLGRGAGYGIIEGFNVSALAGNTQLQVTAGLGLNRKGNIVQLIADTVNLPIQPITEDQASLRRGSRFEACHGDDATPTSTIDDGAYLLTVSPLAQLEGSVPRKTCDGTETALCANQWEVEGVEFKIIRLTKYRAPTGNRAKRNRNLLAHWFYGSDNVSNLMRDPLKFAEAYTGFAEIAGDDLTECDLPLAVFYWSDNRIAFVDDWAVRRRLIHPYPGTSWRANISDQRVAEGEARFLQFQTHLASLQSFFGSNTRGLRAIDRFAYLPPVGIVPVNPFELVITDVFETILKQDETLQSRIIENELRVSDVLEKVRRDILDQFGDANVFRLETFFEGLLPKTYEIAHEDFVHDRLHQSWVQPPIPMPPPTVQGGKFFDFVLPNNNLIEVTDIAFDVFLDDIEQNFDGSLYMPTAVIAESRLGANNTRRDESASNETPIEAAAFAELRRVSIVGERARFVPPRDIFVQPEREDEEPEPLIDIWVVDEMLEPYRSQLSSEMRVRINAAITSLVSGDDGNFISQNQFAAFNNAVGNAFILNTLLWQAANSGIIQFNDLLQLVSVAEQPSFYVVFVRHRPEIQSRAMRI